MIESNFDADLSNKNNPFHLESLEQCDAYSVMIHILENDYIYYISKRREYEKGFCYNGLDKLKPNEIFNSGTLRCIQSKILSLHEIVYQGHISRFGTHFSTKEREKRQKMPLLIFLICLN